MCPSLRLDTPPDTPPGGEVKEQKRSRKIAMSAAELDEFLRSERTCRLGTLGPNGPHVSPLWYVWDGNSLWITSLVRSQRWTDLERDPRVSVVVDAGEEYLELRGAELIGSVETVGEVPRTGEPNQMLEEPERLMAMKYSRESEMTHDNRHAWLRLSPEKVVSWDFRKIASLKK